MPRVTQGGHGGAGGEERVWAWGSALIGVKGGGVGLKGSLITSDFET